MIPETYEGLVDYLHQHMKGITTKDEKMVFPELNKIPPGSFIVFISFADWEKIKAEGKKRRG